MSRTIDLFPPPVLVDGTVASSLTGQAIGGAAITVSGKTSENTVWSLTATSDSNGRFTVPTYPGTYVITATLAGYAPTNQSVTLVAGTSSVPVSLALVPLSATGSSTPSYAATAELIGIVVAVGIVVGALLLWMRPPANPRGSSSRPPRSPPRIGGSE